jgi:heptosyltransferase-2
MNPKPAKVLIIQTAFIGDVILATSIAEKWHEYYPESTLDMVVKKGNESLFKNHPYLHRVVTLDKTGGKWAALWSLHKKIRSERYDLVINLHRFFSGGFLAAFSGAKEIRGFRKNPLSVLFHQKYPHSISSSDENQHEIIRNHALIADLTDKNPAKPRLYPSKEDYRVIQDIVHPATDYITVSPASVWYTKQWPAEKWIEFINHVPQKFTVYLLGAPGDHPLCTLVQNNSARKNIHVLAGKLSLLQSAALMQGAVMNFVNDSAPLHLASAMNAPVAAIFCSTVPQFGFGPLSDQSYVFETLHKLDCRPCGLHGRKNCPEGHFRCAEIEVGRLQEILEEDALKK